MRIPTTLLLTLFLTTSLAADPADEKARGSADDPSFYIEEIVVEGTRHASDEIIVSESLLEGGKSYSEDELREAIYRINRLPFVLGVDFELRKGSERGHHVLVVDVLETTRFFFATDLRARALADSRDGSNSDTFVGDFVLGYRHFVGNKGLVFATVGDVGVQVGYSAYNVLNRNAFLNVALERNVLCCEIAEELRFDSSPGPRLLSFDDDTDVLSVTLGIPTSARHMWRVDASHRRSDFRRRPVAVPVDSVLSFVSERDSRDNELRLSWLHDTTDDPIFPSRGDELVASAGLRRSDSESTWVLNFATPHEAVTRQESSSESATLELTGRRYWPIGRRQSLAAGASLLANRSDSEGLAFGVDETFNSRSEAWGVKPSLRHAVDLIGGKRSQPQRRLRWENALEYFYQELSGDGLGRSTFSFSYVAWSSDLVYRSRWGVVRFAFRLTDFLENP